MPESSQFRVISRDFPDGRRILATVTDTGAPDPQADEAVLDRLQQGFDEQGGGRRAGERCS